MTHRISLRARSNQHFTYSGRSILVTNLDGAVMGSGTEGFYVENTRLLCRDHLTANGEPLTTVAASPVGGERFLAYLAAPTGPDIPEKAVSIELRRVVGEGMREEFHIANYAVRDTARVTLALHLDADFADMEETQQGERQQTAAVTTTWDGARQELCFRYDHPDLDRAVAVRVEQSPTPVCFQDGALILTLELPPHTSADWHLVVEPLFDGTRRVMPAAACAEAPTPLSRVRQALQDAAPALTTTNTMVALAWRTAIADLASLPLGLEVGPAAPSAGIPLYQQFFGRDTLTIGWQAVMAMPMMLRDALTANASFQGAEVNDWRDEQPGKIIHQARTGPLSLLNIDPFERYYGDYSAPQDFLAILGEYFGWTDDMETVRSLLPAARRVIDWLDRDGDLDGDGFLEYVTRSEKGVKNQGWKDSGDAIVDEQGKIIPNPIATSEMQGYWFAALEQAAYVFFLAGERRYALELVRKSRALKQRFDKAFWMEDLGFYAMALGPDKRQIRSISSNTGHLLAAGIVPLEKGRQVAQRLMAPDMFSGWGIRTLSSDHAAYNPFSYHLGSVWPIENGTFAYGFARYGCWDELHRLAEGVFASTDLYVANRLPEVIGGFPRDARHAHPGIYPNSNEPQGWSASAIILLVQSLLGMLPIAPLGLLLVDPHLPPWLSDLRLDDVHVGQSRLDLEFRRKKSGTTRYRVTRREGHVRVLRQPIPPAPGVSFGARTLAALTSLGHT